MLSGYHLWQTTSWCWWSWRRIPDPSQPSRNGAPLKRLPWKHKSRNYSVLCSYNLCIMVCQKVFQLTAGSSWTLHLSFPTISALQTTYMFPGIDDQESDFFFTVFVIVTRSSSVLLGHRVGTGWSATEQVHDGRQETARQSPKDTKTWTGRGQRTTFRTKGATVIGGLCSSTERAHHTESCTFEVWVWNLLNPINKLIRNRDW